MRYLKTYYSINEVKSGSNLDLDGFIDIMRDITDDYEHNIEHVQDNPLDEYYDCWIYLNGFDDPELIDAYQFKFLEKLAHSDNPENINNMTDYYNLNINDAFKEENDVLLQNIKYLEKRIEFNNKVKQIFDTIEQYILPRFMEFSNFKKCTLGMESYMSFDNIELGSIRISFDVK